MGEDCALKWAAAGVAVGAVLGARCATARASAAPAEPPAPPAFKWTTGELGKTPMERRKLFRAFVRGLQDEITTTLGELDGKEKFVEDAWVKPNGAGEGRTRVLADGAVFESAGCNWSEVIGENLPPSILKKHPQLKGKKFYATGVSMVIHPRNAHCPTTHLNYRYFEAGDIDEDKDVAQGNVWWFGGGMDLTPWVVYDEDCVSFHQHIKDACDKHGEYIYPALKRYADDYFLNKHREEGRGIGGHFFDYMSGNPEALLFQGENAKEAALQRERGWFAPKMSWTELFAFAKDQGATFLPAYVAIIKRRMHTKETEEERTWQLLRRGRYVEFNLVHDRGTLFGLQVKGRTESILMSLPTLVKWGYMVKPKNDAQRRLVEVLGTPQDWLKVE